MLAHFRRLFEAERDPERRARAQRTVGNIERRIAEDRAELDEVLGYVTAAVADIRNDFERTSRPTNIVNAETAAIVLRLALAGLPHRILRDEAQPSPDVVLAARASRVAEFLVTCADDLMHGTLSTENRNALRGFLVRDVHHRENRQNSARWHIVRTIEGGALAKRMIEKHGDDAFHEMAKRREFRVWWSAESHAESILFGCHGEVTLLHMTRATLERGVPEISTVLSDTAVSVAVDACASRKRSTSTYGKWDALRDLIASCKPIIDGTTRDGLRELVKRIDAANRKFDREYEKRKASPGYVPSRIRDRERPPGRIRRRGAH